MDPTLRSLIELTMQHGSHLGAGYIVFLMGVVTINFEPKFDCDITYTFRMQLPKR